MHRDLKPENILLENKDDIDNLKIIDFGQATFYNGVKKLKGHEGSAKYMAPEVLRHREKNALPYDEKCDIWSIGVIAYVLMVGSFHADTNNSCNLNTI